MKRKNWQPGGGENTQGELRGIDEWERISWDEAIDYIADEMKRIYDTYGPQSVFLNGGFTYGGSGDISNILKKLGGYLESSSTESYGTWMLCTEAMGTTYVNWNPDTESANDRFDLINADTIVLYGCNPAWASAGSPSWHFAKAKESGTKFVYVGPSKNVSANMLDARWIPVRPGTDTAFLLSVAYTMIEDDEALDIIDKSFLDRYTVGYDAEHMPTDAKLNENFHDYVLGTYDDTPKTPEWAHDICGTPVDDIIWYAHEMTKQKNVMLLHSYAASRCNGAENLPQLFLTIGCMGGHLGRSGNACGGTYYYEAGNAGPRLVKMGVPVSAYIPNPVTDVMLGPTQWKEMLEGTYTDFGGMGYSVNACTPGRTREIDIKMFYSIGNNFLQSRMNVNDGIKAYRNAEFVVKHDFKLSFTSQYADIVLPATTHWETYHPDTFHTPDWINRETQVFPSPIMEEGLFEAKDDTWVAEQLADKFGFDRNELFPSSARQMYFDQFAGAQVMTGGEPDATLANLSPDYAEKYGTNRSEWGPLVTITQKDIDEFGVEGIPQEGVIDFKELQSKGIYQFDRHPNDGFGWIAYKDFIEDPEKYPRPSASGKFEIYCQVKADTINGLGFTDKTIKPYANYIVPNEGYEASFSNWETKEKGDFPLQMYTPHYIRRSHTSFDNLPWLQEAFENPVFLNASDASERGIVTGDTVLVSSKWGKVLRHASVLESMIPGAIGLPHGARSDIDGASGIDKGGNENVLLGPVTSNFFPQVSGYNTCLVQVEKYPGEPIPYDYEKSFAVDLGN